MRHTAPLADLIEQVDAASKATLAHKFRVHYLRRMFELDLDHYDPVKEAVVLADFASAMKLGSGFRGTCEGEATCNLYVVLVLYHNAASGKEECAWLRFWSSANTSAAFHHHALHVAKDFLMGGGADARLPGLKRFRVWTDGHSSTYKGPNFGRMAYWPLERPAGVASPTADGSCNPSGICSDCAVDCEGIEVNHCVLEAHHASGVQDSAGAEARRSMSADLAYDEHLSIYNYYQCYKWSLEHNFTPAGDGSAGQWSPNEYGGCAFPLKSGDPYISFFNMEFHLDTRRKEYSKVPGRVTRRVLGGEGRGWRVCRLQPQPPMPVRPLPCCRGKG